jgi:hypothetical protein
MRDRLRLLSLSLIFAALSYGCHEGATETVGTVSNTGRYAVSWSRGAASCAPLALPAAVNASPGDYASIPAAAYSIQTSGEIDGANPNLSLRLTDASGFPLVTLDGQFSSANEPTVFAGETSRVEGPRVGGHSFTAVEARSDTLLFEYLVETPPGHRIEVDFSGGGVTTIAFRDGGPSGAVYTTCKYVDTLTGSQIAQ